MPSILHFLKNYYTNRNCHKAPNLINIEITSVCDSRCIHCPRHNMNRQMKPIDFNLFKKIIDQAAQLKVYEIALNGFGELLTMKDLPKYIEYIRSKKHHFQIVINTNANQLSDDKIDLFIKHQVNMLNICLDGATHETMAKIRKNLNPERIESNIKKLIQKRNEQNLKFPIVRTGFIAMDINRHEIDDFINKWTPIVDMVGIDGYSNRGDSLEKHSSEADKTKTTCILPFNSLNIWSDGICVLCCNDWNEEYVVGDANYQSITEIWHSEKLKEVRKAHYEKNGQSIDFCRKCNWWLEPEKGQKIWY